MTDSLDAWLDAEHRRAVERLRQRRPSRAAAPAPTAAPTERDARKAVVSWLRKAGCIVSSNINEVRSAESDPHKRARFWAALVATGCTKGFPDLTCITPQGRVVLIELKRPRRGRVSDAQAALHEALRARGVPVIVGTDIWSVADGLAAAGISLGRPAA